MKQWLEKAAAWCGQRVSVVLMLLMVQMGVALGLMAAWQSPPARSADGGTRGGGDSACGALEVAFAPGATVRDLRRWMLNFNANIVQGPNERGAFELNVPGQGPDAVRASLGELADAVQSNPLCTVQP
ncbi:hypothetical protein PSQ20_03925 [Curvibacter sp. RS43]|uniref:Uncharacterized protein n=1 Tax=Curvibacter microcysteis TaxID=3026419 RepID=A0ABT5MDW8_9BURK|nr:MULTISPECIES: hypothetical protein [unclassified Curvibacter]MDD0809471.1 hypothetical protein [Curvibacter sp. RS43]MDD0814570.1 hypothetical protein [Curvibacter sp. HBC28]